MLTGVRTRRIRQQPVHDHYVATVNHLVATGRDELIEAVVAEYEDAVRRPTLRVVAA